MIPFIDLVAQRRRLGRRLDEAIATVVEHGQFILGPEVGRVEAALAAFSGANAVVTCANGTDALELAIRVAGVTPGQGVIVPSFTFCATAEAVVAAGGIPVFADVEEGTFNIAATSVASAFDAAASAGLEVAGIIPVDLFGVPAAYPLLAELATSRNVWVIADAAQSFGATLNRRVVGTLAPLTATSFFPAKPLGCFGDGGAVFVESPQHADLLRSFRVHGQGSNKYENVRIGRNSRLDTIQAAVLLEKLAIFRDELDARQRVAARYTRDLQGAVVTPHLAAEATSAWAQYTVMVEPSRRDEIRKRLGERGIPTVVYYPLPLHRQPAYQGFPRATDELPVSDRMAASVLSLPMHPYLEAPLQDTIVEAVIQAVQ